jgi:DNA-binding response OmpR family regulator
MYTQLYSGIKTGRTTKGILVIVSTAVDLGLNMKLRRDMGASGYVTKPFNPEKVLSPVKPVLGEQERNAPLAYSGC